MRRILSIVLILLGISVAAFPKLKVIYSDYKQKEVLKSWEEDMKVLESIKDENLSENKESNSSNASEEEKRKAEEYRKWKEEYVKKNMGGILTIDKIGLKLPILKGATKENLNISPSTIENMGKVGEIGNFGIAGHKSHTYGVHFNRINELNVGDEIKFFNGEKTFVYKVIEKILVKPEETWVLEGNKIDKLISLVTCDYRIKPTGRLIVRGKLVE